MVARTCSLNCPGERCLIECVEAAGAAGRGAGQSNCAQPTVAALALHTHPAAGRLLCCQGTKEAAQAAVDAAAQQMCAEPSVAIDDVFRTTAGELMHALDASPRPPSTCNKCGGWLGFGGGVGCRRNGIEWSKLGVVAAPCAACKHTKGQPPLHWR